MINPFKKRQQRKAAAAAGTSSHAAPTDYAAFPSSSRLPPRPGIFIAAAAAQPASPNSAYTARQQRALQPGPPQWHHQPSRGADGSTQQAAQPQSLDHVLPPTSDFRQSLIMPHLTRRFTLLRAPDGSLVSPDAMRAHLRAQRARARAANLAIGAGVANHVHFLTEDEENAIIEQLKAQARAEGRDFDLEQAIASATVDSWRSGYAAGTDGFGSWGTSLTNTTTQLSSLAESLGDLSSSPVHSSSTRSPTRTTGGGAFFGSSTERDHAHFRNSQKARNVSKPEGIHASTKPDVSAPLAHGATPEPPATDASPENASRAAPTSNEQTDAPAADLKSGSKSLLDVPGTGPASRSSSSQDFNLLTTLSPEAFKRVSTALDEVFAQIASQQAPPSVKSDVGSRAESNHRPQRSSGDSDANSFASALSHVRSADPKPTPPATTAADPASEDEDAADTTITAPKPTLDAVHIEQGGLAMSSPIRDAMGGAVPGGHVDFLPQLPESETATQLPTLVASDSALTVTDATGHPEPASDSLAPSNGTEVSEHLRVSPSPAPTHLSLRNSSATATEVASQNSRIVSTASTIEAPQQNAADEFQIADGAAGIAAGATPAADSPASIADSRPSHGAAAARQPARPDRTPDMNNATAFIGSPAYSTLSRGDSIISANSGRSSLAGPPASNYSSSHSRKSSADKLALARAMAPHPSLREQPSLSSVRRNFKQHVRSATGSSEGSILGAHASRRSSGAMSPPPMLSRSARSPNYFPPPASNVSMHDYASGFKPPSAVSPAAAAALQSMTGQAHSSPQPANTSVLDASNALRSAQSMRNSASTSQSAASPHVPGVAAFGSGSDRAAGPGSPETGSTSYSLHQRNASLSSSKQHRNTQSSRISSTDDGYAPSMAAPRPAPVPVAVAPQTTQPATAPAQLNERGLMPQPPSEPEQAERWRAMYGIKATDAVSLRASTEDVSADPNDDEDLWAKMASASDSASADRPISNLLPTGTPDERLVGTGITFDQIARFQDHLIQTADGREAVPPLPRLRADDNVQERRFAEAKSKGLASPNLVIGTGSEWTKPSASVQQNGDGQEFGLSNGKPAEAGNGAPLTRNPSSSISHDPPISPRAVMYDVTTSHRPTSPPLHSRNGSLNGLPSLLELNGSVGHRNRESFSLSHAVDQAARMYHQPMFTSPSVAEEPGTVSDQDSRAVVSSPPVQQHPFNAGYTSPSLPAAESRGPHNFTFPRKNVQEDIGASPRSQAQQFPPEDVWNRYGPQQDSSPDTSIGAPYASPFAYPAPDPTSLLDDVAAQTSAATRALKGKDDGSVPTPPFRTKSISRKKSFKKVSKQISTPQLISTTQKLDYANQIALPPETPAGAAKSSKRMNRSPGWGSLSQAGLDGSRGHPKASPSTASQGGSASKGSGYFHRRRSSSFGHEASPSDSFGLANGGADGSATEPVNGERAAVHPNHPYMHGGANGGSLSRLFSKMKSRKNGEHAFGGATIEPFPPQLSEAARAAESAPQQVQQSQQFEPADAPVLPPVERTTPWTLPPVSSPGSAYSDRGSSVRSPTSPVYTLPIDSTSMPRKKTKKRTPIVLKRESEVILPGDPGYIPTAIIGRSPEERARELDSLPEPAPPISLPYKADEAIFAEAAQPAEHQEPAPEGDPAASETQDAQVVASEDAPASNGDVPDSLAPIVDPAAGEEEMRTPRPPSSWNGEAAEDDDGDATLPAVAAPSAEEEAEQSSANARKSLRDTIVRRTIIVPAGIEFGDNRRSFFGSNRKSRRFAAAEEEPLPSAGMGETRPSSEIPAVAEGGVEEAMSTLSSRQTLRPESGAGSKRASRVESSYAGSLYDMYIGDNIEFGSPGSETRELARRSMAAGAAGRRHIEVTERADGSVVWQVLAGLADRGSVYSDLDPRHSRHNSDASGANLAGIDAVDEEPELEHWRTPAGLTADDSRSFFTRPRAGHRKSFSFDAMPPLPTSTQQEVFEIANPPSTRDAEVEEAKNAEPTTIVYHNDAQLASLLDVLAKGKDSAKFEFHLGPDQALGGSAAAATSAPLEAQPWTGEVLDADDIESHRNRVEAEIYTLLNQHALRARPPPQ